VSPLSSSKTHKTVRRPAQSSEDAERQRDLEFILELRKATLSRLQQIARNLSFGGPEWQRVAVRRVIFARKMSKIT